MPGRGEWFERDVTPRRRALPKNANRQALLAAVLAAMEDDAPRLIYADWLLEQGDPRGELIAIQCELYRDAHQQTTRLEQLRAREAELLAKHKKTWVGQFAGARTEYGTSERSWVKGSPTRWEFERGFVRSVTMSTRDLARIAEVLFQSEPVVRVHVTDSALAQVVSCPGLDRVRELDVSRSRLKEDALRVLFSTDALRSLEELDLTKCGIGPKAVKTITAATGRDARDRFPKLRRIIFADNALGDSGAEALAALPFLAIEGLELNLARNKIGSAGAHALATAAPLERIGKLNLFGNSAITDDVHVSAALRARFGARVVLPGDDH